MYEGTLINLHYNSLELGLGEKNKMDCGNLAWDLNFIQNCNILFGMDILILYSFWIH